MAKTWEQMTQAEKIEDLRRDVKAIFEALNELALGQRALGQRLDSAASLALEVSKKVDRRRRRFRCAMLRGRLDHGVNGALECGPVALLISCGGIFGFLRHASKTLSVSRWAEKRGRTRKFRDLRSRFRSTPRTAIPNWRLSYGVAIR
jgi:hypothetical protein